MPNLFPPDDLNVAATAAGSFGGLLGGVTAAFFGKQMSRKEMACCVIGGLSVGAFLPPWAVAELDLKWQAAGALGLCSGIAILTVISVIQNGFVGWIRRLAGDKGLIEKKGEGT